MQSKKLLLSLFSLSLLGGVALSGCGGNNDPKPEPTPEPVYTINEADYLLLRSKVNNPRYVLENNFSLNVNDVFESKVDKGKIDTYIEGDHVMLDLDVSTYNSETTAITGDTYYFDKDDKEWYRIANHTSPLSQTFNALGFYYFVALPDSYEDLVYNETKHTYKGIVTIEGESFQTTFVLLNGRFVEFELSYGETHLEIDFFDYDSTTVEFPSKYIDEDE